MDDQQQQRKKNLMTCFTPKKFSKSERLAILTLVKSCRADMQRALDSETLYIRVSSRTSEEETALVVLFCFFDYVIYIGSEFRIVRHFALRPKNF